MKFITFFSKKAEYRSLSNFYECEVEIDGVKYPSGENAFQSQKFLTAAATCDDPARAEILRAHAKKLTDAFNPKQMSKYVTLKESELEAWRSRSVAVQTAICEYKYKTNETVARDLIASGDATLVHPGMRKKITALTCWEGRVVGDKVVGENLLGKIWMSIRDINNFKNSKNSTKDSKN